MSHLIANDIRRIFAEGAALFQRQPAFDVTSHVARSAEVEAFRIDTARIDARPYAIMEEAAVERMQGRGCL